MAAASSFCGIQEGKFRAEMPPGRLPSAVPAERTDGIGVLTAPPASYKEDECLYSTARARKTTYVFQRVSQCHVLQVLSTALPEGSPTGCQKYAARRITRRRKALECLEDG